MTWRRRCFSRFAVALAACVSVYVLLISQHRETLLYVSNAEPPRPPSPLRGAVLADDEPVANPLRKKVAGQPVTAAAEAVEEGNTGPLSLTGDIAETGQLVEGSGRKIAADAMHPGGGLPCSMPSCAGSSANISAGALQATPPPAGLKERVTGTPDLDLSAAAMDQEGRDMLDRVDKLASDAKPKGGPALAPKGPTLERWYRQQPRQADGSISVRKFYSNVKNFGIVGRELKSRGWVPTLSTADAEILVVHTRESLRFDQLSRWQLPNRLQHETVLSNKRRLYELVEVIAQQRPDLSVNFLPNTYVLKTQGGRNGFTVAAIESITTGDDGVSKLVHPWVVKDPGMDAGKGIRFLSTVEELRSFVKSVHAGNENSRIVQEYLTNLLTLPDGRKFDLRVYWFVASVNPPIVYFRDGTVRATATPLNLAASGWEDARAHMTNAKVQQKRINGTGVSKDGALGQLIDPERLRLDMVELKSVLEAAFPSHPDPMGAVTCQMERAIAIAFESARHSMIDLHTATDNAFSLLGGDFMIDVDLHVWMTELQSAPGVATETRASREVWESMVPEMVDLVLEVRDLQLAGREVRVPLKSQRHMRPIVVGAAWQWPIHECHTPV